VGERLQVNIPKAGNCFYSNIIHYSGCTAASGLKRVLREMFLSVQGNKAAAWQRALYTQQKRIFSTALGAPLFLMDILEVYS